MLKVTRRRILQAGGTLGALTAVSPLVMAADKAKPADIGSLPRVRQKLVKPPFAPVHQQVAEGGPKIIEVELVV